MSKNKLQKFEENKTFTNLIQPTFDEVLCKDYYLKGKWRKDFFKNENPIVLELGCGRGEYTVNLAKTFPNKNFIGFDIKGARLWKGAKMAFESNMNNVAFVRTKIEFLNSFFKNDEIEEIWITFPDPQPNKECKRLTSALFLNKYNSVLKLNGLIHLKTDSKELYEYTNRLIDSCNLQKHLSTNDLYNSGLVNEILKIKTYYENMFLSQNKPITYIKFSLIKGKELFYIEKTDDTP